MAPASLTPLSTHLLGSSFPNELHDWLYGCATDNRVVHQHHSAASHILSEGGEFTSDVPFARLDTRLDEGPSYVAGLMEDVHVGQV